MYKTALLTLSLALLVPQQGMAENNNDKKEDFDPSQKAKTAIYLKLDDDSPKWMLGLAPRLGVGIPTSKLGPCFLAALSIDVFPPLLNNQLVVALDFSFTRPGHDGSGNDPRLGDAGDYTYDVKVLQLKWGLDVIYRFFDSKHRLVPFAGAGFITQFMRSKQTNNIDDLEQTEWNFKPGFEVLGGVDFKLGPGFLVGDVRYTFAMLDHQITGDKNAGNVTIAVGYRYYF